MKSDVPKKVYALNILKRKSEVVNYKGKDVVARVSEEHLFKFESLKELLQSVQDSNWKVVHYYAADLVVSKPSYMIDIKNIIETIETELYNSCSQPRQFLPIYDYSSEEMEVFESEFEDAIRQRLSNPLFMASFCKQLDKALAGLLWYRIENITKCTISREEMLKELKK